MHCCAQVTRVEYVLLWGTYISIMLTDLEAGIGIGIILSTLYFTFSYAKARATTDFLHFLPRLFKHDITKSGVCGIYTAHLYTTHIFSRYLTLKIIYRMSF